jgi:glucokinase-like ROK family protein
MTMIFWQLSTLVLKNLNRHAVIDSVRFTPGGIARIELARRLGLTRAAITTIVDDLLTGGLLRETEGHYPNGRKPIVLEINPERGKVVGIDMGATHLNLILADFSARELDNLEVRLDINDGPGKCLAAVEEQVHRLLQRNGYALGDIDAIGLGVPGPIISKAGMVSGPPIMPGWDGYPIRDHLYRVWGCPVTLNNDAELGVLGEWAYGAGRGERNLAYIKVGTGIGAGLLVEGQLYSGSTGSAGEIGHITIDENGPICSCGNRGCLEAFAGGIAIVRKANEAVRRGLRTQLTDTINSPDFSAKDVISAARRGDLVSQRIVMEAGMHLGTAIASMVNLLNPDIVIIGGSISQIGDLLLEPIRSAVNKRSLLPASRSVRITAALLGHRSCAMGAVVQAISIAIHRMVEERDHVSMDLKRR